MCANGVPRSSTGRVYVPVWLRAWLSPLLPVCHGDPWLSPPLPVCHGDPWLSPPLPVCCGDHLWSQSDLLGETVVNLGVPINLTGFCNSYHHVWGFVRQYIHPGGQLACWGAASCLGAQHTVMERRGTSCAMPPAHGFAATMLQSFLLKDFVLLP